MRRGLVLPLGLGLAVLATPAAQPAPPVGVVVETIGPGWSGATQAGLRPGDMITAWAPAGSAAAGDRTITGLADWLDAEAEHGLRVEGVRATYVREGRTSTTDLRGGAWTMTVAPLLSGTVASDHQRALALAARADQAQAARVWRELADRTRADADPALAIWFHLREGRAAVAARDPAAARTAFANARTLAAERRLVQLEREALAGIAGAALSVKQVEVARQTWTDVVALFERERPTSPMYVRALNNLARLQRDFGPLSESGRTDQRALEIARAVAPGSIAEVTSLTGLALTARRTGNLADGERWLDEAAALLERFPATHPERAVNAANRGTLLVQQNRLAEAERQLMLAESLDHARGASPEQLALSNHLNLGVVAAMRGDLARAEGYFRSSLDAERRASANPIEVVRSSSNLAVLIAQRGDHARALEVFESTRDLAERLAPNSPTLAEVLVNLGTARARVGDLAGSTAAFEQALAVRQSISPDDDSIAGILNSLASNAEKRGDLAAATALSARAVAHADRVAPGGLAAARTYHMAARIALARGDLAAARRLQDAGLGLARAIVPGSRIEAASLAMLAAIDVREARLESAARRYLEAIDTLNLQVRRLGAALDVEAAYIDDVGVQRPYVEVLLALGRESEALEALERFRARSLLDRLSSRDLAFGRSGEADRLARDRRRLNQEYDATLAQLARLPPTAGPDQVKELQSRLADIRDARALAASNLRRVDATLADQLDPSPLPLASLQQSLRPGALALVYHLGPDRPVVFAVARDRWRVAPLASTTSALNARVATWRRLVDRGRTEPEPGAALLDESRALYRALLGPVEDDVRRAERLIIVSDGALHGLSFSALVVPGNTPAVRYLIESKPVSVVPSLTVLAHLKTRPMQGAAPRKAAVLGDARFGADARSTPGPGEQAVRAGLVGRLDPLPGTRREAERVAALLAPGATLLLGADATETAIKRLPRDTAVVHIATHGVLSETAPLESALVLTSRDAEGDNGLLQAWEIFDQVRVDADLVVLSACDTGLGRAFDGEGLVGLTRAFQFAGARAVAASLWKAPDDATARLMESFYRAIREERARVDVALALAQRALLGRPETRHPFYWAGFVIDGDMQ
jgi:CHAT domain-containing protein/Tfp pilus assembly protein PilF